MTMTLHHTHHHRAAATRREASGSRIEPMVPQVNPLQHGTMSHYLLLRGLFFFFTPRVLPALLVLPVPAGKLDVNAFPGAPSVVVAPN